VVWHTRIWHPNFTDESPARICEIFIKRSSGNSSQRIWGDILVSTGKVSSESKGKKVKPSAEERRTEESRKEEAAEVKEERQRVVEIEVFGWRLVHELLSQEEQEEVLRRYRTTRPHI
jgi:hypothetical protein